MNKKIKSSIYFLFICLFAIFLGACSAKSSQKGVDEQTSNNLIMMSDNLISQISSLDDEAIDRNIEDLNSKKQFELEAALVNWKSVKGELGDIKAISAEEARVLADKNTYTVAIPIVGEKRTAVVRITFEDNMQKISSMSINPDYSLGEKLSKAGLNTFIGMATVFIILIFIIFIIDLFKYIRIFEEKFKKQDKELEEPKKEEVSLEENLMEDEELVAVISAAIMAYESEQGDDDLIVRSLKKAKRNKRF